MGTTYSIEEAKLKLEYYCSYQERCHTEVLQKLRAMHMIPQAIDLIIVHLIDNNFLNEERYACSFARGKHRIKHWGRIRIVNELKFKNISKYTIDKALKEIPAEEYYSNFQNITERYWESMRESNSQKKRKKFCDYFLRKGFESAMIYEKVIELENNCYGLNSG